MNPVERVIRRADAAQRRHTPAAFVVGVAKKFGDDNGGILVAGLAHSAFVSIFPLLLVLVTILGLVASGDPTLRHEALKAVAQKIPLIGRQLATNVHALRRSSIIGLVIGLLVTTWGATGLAQAGMFMMQQVWNLPGPARPGYWQRLGRAMAFLVALGVGVVVTTPVTALVAFGGNSTPIFALAELLVALASCGMYLVCFRLLTAKGVPTRALVAGSVVGGVAWTLLQLLGGYLVRHYLTSYSVYGVFATVLGLAAWIYIGVEITVYSAEVNVVLARRLWPRSIVQPPLTEADRAVMAAQALQNQRREEQRVSVTFADRPQGRPHPAPAPRTPEEISPPADPK